MGFIRHQQAKKEFLARCRIDVRRGGSGHHEVAFAFSADDGVFPEAASVRTR